MDRQRFCSPEAGGFWSRPGLVARVAVLLTAGVVIFLTAPRDGSFGYPDAARHALNGAFILDFLKALPLDNPIGWAAEYYLQYPALTVGFYPPLFHLALALFYAVLGVTQPAAIAAEVFFVLLLATAVYSLVRRSASPASALAGSLMMLSTPLVLLWGRQVMLDVPMLALATWSVVFLLRYADSDRLTDLAVSAIAMLLALYTKQQAAFVIAGAVTGWVLYVPRRRLGRGSLWLVGALTTALVLPVAWLQFRFGSFALSAVDLAGALPTAPLHGIQQAAEESSALFYLVRLPAMLGPVLLPALVYLAGSVVLPAWRPRRSDGLVLTGWFVVSYLCLAVIGWKDERFALPLLPPLVVGAALLVDRLVPAVSSWIGPVLGVLLLGLSLATVTVPVVVGHREAALLVARQAPPDARIMFLGNRDGAFIFHVRASTGRRDLTVVRADKLFLGIVVSPEGGLRPKDMTRDEILDTLERYAITHVVAEPRVWEEAPVIADLHDILRGPSFSELARIPVTGLGAGAELVILRNLGPIADAPAALAVDVPLAGLTFEQQEQ